MRDAPPLPTRPLAEQLAQSGALGPLLARVRASQQRLKLVHTLLPQAWRAQVHSGSLDDAEWHLLVPNAALATKLKQWLPDLDAALLAAGWPPCALKVKIAPQPESPQRLLR